MGDEVKMEQSRYFSRCYGKIGNRPLEEVRRVADLRRVCNVMGQGFREQRYVENEANKISGYCAGERAVLLASIDARSDAEVRFAWHVEMRLAACFRELDRFREHAASILSALDVATIPACKTWGMK